MYEPTQYLLLSVDISVRNVDSLKQSKTELRNLDQHRPHIVPKHYLYGPRKLNIVLTQLRCSASFLYNRLYS